MPDRVGQFLGNYRLTRLLGRGGFAEVYLAQHRRLGTLAAIKVLYTHISASEQATFLAEAQTIAHLEHPHIVRILDFDVQDGTPFLVMNYAPNGTMRQRHPKGTILPVPLVLSYLQQITNALQYAHERKVIHRDIKPENILLGRNDEVLLSDFGIATIAQSSRLQSTKEVLGTASYMAPEQLQGKPRLASDQYSLGVVAYEWLTGERPFHGTFLELYSQHLSIAPPSLRSKVPTLSPKIEQVILTALAKDPARRFRSVESLAHAFEQAAALPSIRSRAAQGNTVSTPAVSPRNPAPLVAHLPAMTVTPPDAMLVKPNALSPGPSPAKPGPEAQPAQPAPINAVQQPRPASQRDILLSPPHLLPSGPSGANPTPTPQQIPSLPNKKRNISRRAIIIGGLAALPVAAGGLWMLLSQLPQEGKIAYTYHGHSGAVNIVVWSPDGTRIASGSTDYTVQVWNATNGSPLFTYKGHSGAVNSLAWSPGSTSIASGSFDDTVQVWNAINGSSSSTYHGHSSAVNAVAWSPDGNWIASGSADYTVRIWNASNGNAPFIYHRHSGAVNSVAWSPNSQRIASGSADDTVHVWNAADGSSPYIYKGHSNGVNAVTWSPNGVLIASASTDGTVQVWNASNGSLIYTYKGHSNAVMTVAWSPDGKWLASGSADTTVQIWNAIDGSSPFTYKGHSSPVNAVTWSPNSKWLASGSTDNAVQVWQGP